MIEKFKQFWSQFIVQSKAFYAGLTKGRKIAIALSLFTVVFALAMFIFWKPTIKYETAYMNLSADDKTAILAHLKKSGIKDFKMEGDSLSFPEDKILEARMLLAQEGLPSSGIGVGWEKFDDRAFGMSDFDQRINKLRALQGELARTINKLEPVANSRVHIVLPDNAIFAEDKKTPTASIFLKLKPSKLLSQRQIQGIIHLAARAVEGLEPKAVSIVDQDGNMLTQPDEQDGGIDKVTSAQREYQKRVERELEQKIRDILARVVGHDKVVSKVQAFVDFKKVETTISDVDPERTAVIASQRNEQSSQGNGLNPTGVPGAKSNLPGEREDIGVAGGLTNSTKSSTENLNFEVKKTLSKIVEPIGNVTKLSASVLVDGKMVDGKFVPRTKEEMEMITKLVKNAIGFQETRDAITVESTQFELDEFALAEKASLSARQASLIQTAILSVVALAAMFFIYIALVRPYFKWLTYDPDKRSKEQLEMLDYELERSGAGARRVQLKEDVPFDKMSPKEQIMYLAKNDPQKTTEAIRQLLNPNH
ncbi:flagellar basal-body MS-ring/collar protein FliF [Fluviispira multicolorata]|uniref:Flagellar M-ring protein n=1 Tax=Fluviispira multicolorata TaxID=2654512 RepID=A0A833JFY8_9BACT|nr:flagellar basal-body MS-ring/collar protein FliF [Fluviispira multicolorata]KAB8031902.1 flagellar M-ring protein FliF [Fluviispira multicolorata]